MSLSRRDLLKSAAGAGAFLIARPLGALATPLGPTGAFGTSRVSRLFAGTRLAHADLHNHTLLSDGDGDPANAFASMRDHGLDIAALTDHSTTGKIASPPCPSDECADLLGIDEAKWGQLRTLADAANADGAFVAMRGFEWSSPTLGHVNVWFSEKWTDPLSTAGMSQAEGLGQWAREMPGLGEPLGAFLDGPARTVPAGLGMQLFYDWLKAAPDRPGLGGGLDGIFGFNHPGREPGRFGYFAYDVALRDRLVSLEVFNRREDYLFEGVDANQPSPLVECLDKGWRAGLLGVTDEHGANWGQPDGKGRAGLWVNDLTRDGVREAMLARRFFATNLRGLRLDAGAASTAGAMVQMGSTLAHSAGPITFSLDVDRGVQWVGKPLKVQVLQTGRPLPTVVHVEDVVVPSPDQPVVSFTVPVDAANGRWIVLRVTDPELGPDGRAFDTYAGFGAAIAYASPFWLDPSAI